MEQSTPLVSIILINHYNRSEIFTMLDSIIRQDYPNFELFIGDDTCGNSFDVDEIITHISQKRAENLKQVRIYEKPAGMSTVEMIEALINKSEGEILVQVSADDIFHSNTVLTKFVKTFEKEGPELEWLVSQTKKCDSSLKQNKGLFIPEAVIDILRLGSTTDLMNKMCEAIVIPGAGCAYRRSFFKKINEQERLSQKYQKIESYAAHLRALRMGIKPHYVDIISVRHRYGGVAHGNNSKSERSMYAHDYVTTFEHEIFQHQNLFSNTKFKKVQERHAYWSKEYVKILDEAKDVEENDNENHKKTASRSLWIKTVLRQFRPSLYDLSRKKEVLGGLKLLAFVLLLDIIWSAGNGIIPYKIGELGFGIAIVVVCFVTAFRVGINLLFRLREKIKGNWK